MSQQSPLSDFQLPLQSSLDNPMNSHSHQQHTDTLSTAVPEKDHCGGRSSWLNKLWNATINALKIIAEPISWQNCDYSSKVYWQYCDPYSNSTFYFTSEAETYMQLDQVREYSTPDPITENMSFLASTPTTILQPDQGNTLAFFGNTVTCKFSDKGQGSRIYEVRGTARSGIPSLHSHPWDEWFYFLEGTVNFQVGNQVVQATPGYAINLPAGVPHTFQITSPQAKFLVRVSDAAAEAYLNELAEAAQSKDLTPEAVMAIGQKHHIRSMTPPTPTDGN
jgi:mannose-6-phosphate isomerase-like protein (cupin superfamily)